MKNKTRKQKGFAFIELLLLIAILIVSGGIGYLLLKKDQPTEQFNVNEQLQQQKENKESETQKNVPPATTDCGTATMFDSQNFNCFINAAQNCSLAKVTTDLQVDLFGMISRTSTFYEIKGWQENKCLFYIKSVSGGVTFSQELIQKLLSNGITNDQIKQQEQESSKLAKSIVGRDGICKFANTNNLISLLNKWQEGSFSTNDFKSIDCKGEYFGQGEQMANTSQTISDQECRNQKGYATAVTDTGTSCFKNQKDIGTIVGPLKMSGKYPQCCVQK